MQNKFNSAAIDFDGTFSYTEIGKLMRRRLWDYFDETIPSNSKLNILELNCDAGENAIYLAKKGHYVTATDSSSKMLSVAKWKAEKNKLNNKIDFLQININNLKSFPADMKYDLIISNFGGFNSVNPATLLSTTKLLSKMITSKGRIIAVVMPKFCLWESVYFFFRFQFGKMFRRNSNQALNIDVEGSLIRTWYYSPEEFGRKFLPAFKTVQKKPIGLFIPPSYLDNFFKKKRVLGFLNFLENKFGFSVLSGMADHYIMDLQLRR